MNNFFMRLILLSLQIAIAGNTYEAPVQKGNTSIFSQLDKGFRKNGASHKVLLTENNSYNAVPERKSQESIYVDMEGAESNIPATRAGRAVAPQSNSYPKANETEPIYFQEPDGVAYYDSFDEFDDDELEDYAEMTAPAQTVSKTRYSILNL